MDLSNPSSHSPALGTEEDQRGSSNCTPPDCPELDRTTMVSRPHSDAGGWPTAATPAPIAVVSPISANSIPSPVELPLLGTINKQLAFQRKLLTSCWPHGERPPRSSTQAAGRPGYAGVLNGVAVPFQLL